MVLVMEAFQGHEDKILYDIHGHSGEGYGIEFVDASKPPKDNKDRLDVIKVSSYLNFQKSIFFMYIYFLF